MPFSIEKEAAKELKQSLIDNLNSKKEALTKFKKEVVDSIQTFL